jgi:putative acetyltransferase
MQRSLETDNRTVAIREVEDADGAGVAALIAACFAEYEGCLYEPSEFPELRAPASWSRANGARFWVAEEKGAIVGCICATPRPNDRLELHKFYVAAHLRGQGLADRLTDRFFALAREHGAHQALLWTDTRFTRAHSYYRKLGFRPTGETRDLDDVSKTSEFLFLRALAGD